MPIYEFFCSDCNRFFNFFSHGVNTTKRPMCPKCKKRKLKRQISQFATPRRGSGGGGEGEDEFGDLPIDESRMESAVNELASEAENISESDPRQAAQLMRKFSKMTGMEFGEGMEGALSRLEAGEDPERVEQEMGDLLEKEDPFVKGGTKKRGSTTLPPTYDKTLYEM